MANEIQFPTSPTNGNIYSMGGRNYRYDSAQDKFVAVATATIVEGGGVTIYATIDDLPLSGNTQGDLAHVTANNTLYFWNGSGWYKIALINNSPSISNVNSSYTLSDVGADTVITMIAEDPEGLAITYSIASDTSGNTATVVQGTGANTNIFTITPSTDANDNGTFSLTFRASDGVNIATAPASFTLNISTIIENSNYTTALITSVGTNLADNNDFIDSSTNNFAITPAGNATQTTFSPHRHGGYSTYFDGAGDYLKVADSAEHEFGTGDFSIEFWWWPETLTGGTGSLHIAISAPNDSHNQLIYHESTYWYYGAGAGGTVRVNSSGNGPATAKAWNHVVLCRTGTTLSIFHNGTRTGSVTSSYSADFSNASIGRYDSGGYEIDGYIRDMRWLKGSSAYDATQTSITVPTEPLTAITNTTLLTCHLPYIADGSTNSHAITVNGNIKTEPFAPYDYIDTYAVSTNGGSIYFDGNGDYVTVPSGAHFADFGTADFTVEWWEYITAWPSQYFPIFHYGSLGDTSNFTTKFGIRYEGSGASIRIGVSGGYFDFTGLTTPLNVWRHCAIVRSGTTATLYRNGKVDGSFTFSTNITQQNGQSIFGGAYFGGGSGSLFSASGFINDLRVVKGTAIYTSTFTPPTAPLTAITNTSLLFNGTNAGIIDKSQSIQTLTLNGNISSSTTQTKYLSSSMYFDGTGDYLALPSNTLDWLANLSSVGTIEAWVYYTNSRNGSYVYSHPSIIALGNTYFTLNVDSAGTLRFYWYNGNTNAIASTAPAISANNWAHVAAVITATSGSNNVTLYVNGNAVGTGTYGGMGSPHAATALGQTTHIGWGNASDANSYWPGYLSDVRITKGLARYTANFTPPTEALLG